MARQGPVRVGVTRVEVEDQVNVGLGGYSHTQTKEAFFNLDGYRAVRKAISARRLPRPDVRQRAVR